MNINCGAGDSKALLLASIGKKKIYISTTQIRNMSRLLSGVFHVFNTEYEGKEKGSKAYRMCSRGTFQTLFPSLVTSCTPLYKSVYSRGMNLRVHIPSTTWAILSNISMSKLTHLNRFSKEELGHFLG